MALLGLGIASFSFLFAVAAAVPVAPTGSVKVVAIVKGLRQVPEAQDVQLFRATPDSKSETPKSQPLKLHGDLAPGDRFLSLSGETVVQIRCADGTLLAFRKRFDVLLLRKPKRASCAVDLRDGHLGVLADRPTEGSAVGIPLASKGTAYSVDVQHRSGETADVRLAVFEGHLDVGTRKIQQSKAVTIPGGRPIPEPGEIDKDQDVLPMARLLCDAEIAQAQERRGPFDNPQAAFSLLELLHTRVLLAPDDPKARQELARLQLSYGLEDRARFHLRRAGMSDAEIRKLLEPSKSPAPSGSGEETAVDGLEIWKYAPLIGSGGVSLVMDDLKQRIDHGTVTSQHYCEIAVGLAALLQAKSKQGDPLDEGLIKSMVQFAQDALQRQARDGRLDATQLERCKRFVSGDFTF